jgi:hypothetical protein
MKNLKIFLLQLLNLTIIQGLLFSSIGLAKIVDHSLCLLTTKWDNEMTLSEYMDSCDGAIKSVTGCKINFEKACINGFEVDLMESMTETGLLKNNGFDSHASSALTQNYFSDPSKMYNTVSTPSGKPLRLCTKVDGITKENVGSLYLGNLPTDKDYVIESSPAFLNPDSNIGAHSFHWRVVVSNGQVSVEAEIQFASKFDGPAMAGSQDLTSLTQAKGATIDDINKKLFAENRVRCKKGTTFSDHPEWTAYYKTPAELPDNILKGNVQAFQKAMISIENSGVDKYKLTDNFNKVFHVNLQVAEAPKINEQPNAKKIVYGLWKSQGSGTAREDLTCENTSNGVEQNQNSYPKGIDRLCKSYSKEDAKVRCYNNAETFLSPEQKDFVTKYTGECKGLARAKKNLKPAADCFGDVYTQLDIALVTKAK